MSLQSLDHQHSCISRSFQVINGISCVIRELVENAIDAHSTNIGFFIIFIQFLEIKLYNAGVDLIKVTDNGTGISEINFDNLGSKHSTSKIRKFEDLFTSLTTFGFRGEALYSMCNLSNVEIETRTPNSDNGWLLKFDSLGNIINKSPIASNIGTCVKVRELFGEYPVRRKLLVKNSKSQISKSVSQIQQYALINPHISFNFTTVTNNKKFSNIFATSGSKDEIRGVVEEIFEGLVSNPYNERGYREMEYFYINKRPITKVQKFKNAISAIFSHFSSRAKPSFILNLTMNCDNVDVNISPDKRSAYIYSEDYIIRTFKENLYEILKPKTNLLQINSEILTQFISNSINIKQEKRQLDTIDTNSIKKQTITHTNGDTNEEHISDTMSTGMVTDSMGINAITDTVDNTITTDTSAITYGALNLPEILDTKDTTRAITNSTVNIPTTTSISTKSISTDIITTESFSTENISNRISTNSITDCMSDSITDYMSDSITNCMSDGINLDRINTLEEYLELVEDECCSSISRRIKICERRLFERNMKKLLPEESIMKCKLTNEDLMEHNFLNPQVFEKMELIGQFNKSFIITKLTFPDIKTKYNFSLYVIDQHAADEKAKYHVTVLAQAAPITIISIQLFSSLSGSTLHSYRISSLSRGYWLVIYPLRGLINMSEINRIDTIFNTSKFFKINNVQVAENSMNVLLSNGFDIKVCREKEFLVFNDGDVCMSSVLTEKIGRGVYVNTLPQILGKVLGEDDFIDFLNELSTIDYIENNQQSDYIWGLGNIPRPHKIWSILASKACKSSVRAGDGLTNGQMKNIIKKMGTLIHPWNCPHGRPSIKCLVSHQQLQELLSN
ncbi:DNA mismatch repair protein, putative [Theileria annulata]|uniref:DNA mismatch repair protein, putative n=1 Tax=Theileria annulata TaxID=5874 RepID=Q4UBT8_THEAN|nr:DNA mismatch repair protein, putative [Theileria annulata]CAI75713.1 DNA mismatch repair protein, putative [Theileria annulata]|eukprot:XP_955189.1 DNA mismatch repair protein, putative [Theileria annulata]